MKKKINFYYNDVKTSIKQSKNLKLFLFDLAKTEIFFIDNIDIIFCNDEYLLNINKNVLKHNYYTDIITFDNSLHKGIIISEIYISVERVKDNALIFNKTFSNELHRVIFHGFLHLCGYNDKTKSEINKMRKKEEFYLKKYFSTF